MMPTSTDALSTIRLKLASFADHNDIASLHARSWQQHYRGILTDEYLDNVVVQDRAALWQQRLSSPACNQRIVMAMLENELAGFACVFLDNDPVYGTLLDNLHVSLRLHKLGIGKLLMKECARQVMMTQSTPSMYLWVFEANTNARKFYEGMGGILAEKTKKDHEDGTNALVCRYAWKDVSSIERL
ncbi:MAG TPA: GNAT family N-acetyltransferase [Chitinophagaceae bacterium]|jgi:GNAT superfamily N-acetyltransferase|nr:GNAT family N-acetyltransferase [Chitinophagaceae bacterium]